MAYLLIEVQIGKSGVSGHLNLIFTDIAAFLPVENRVDFIIVAEPMENLTRPGMGHPGSGRIGQYENARLGGRSGVLIIRPDTPEPTSWSQAFYP